MLSALESFGIILASILAALALLFAMRRYWLTPGRSQHNDLIGWQIGFLGTTYAVIVAFVLSDVWNNYQGAERNAQIEANALLNVYRVSEGLRAPERVQVGSLTQQYARAMIDKEWPAMERGSVSSSGTQIIDQLWKVIVSIRPNGLSEQALLERTLADLTTVTEHRRIREVQSNTQLPTIFWLVLITGGALTVIYTCLFDVEELRMHIVQVVGVTLLVTLILTTIADVDAPYGGAVRITPGGFEAALRTMKR